MSGENKSSWEVVPTWLADAKGGYSAEIGAGLSLRQTSSTAPLVAPPKPYKAPEPVNGGHPVIGPPAVVEPATMRSDIALLLDIAMYPWMLLVGVLAFAVVSAPSNLTPPGLNMHWLFGVGAFVLTIWFYHTLMRFMPTMLALAIPSMLLSGFIAWALIDGAGARQFTESVNWNAIEIGGFWSAFLSHAPMFNGWVIAAMVLNLAAHIAFWWNGRSARV